MTQSDTVSVLYTPDGDYWAHTYISIWSLLDNNRDNQLDIYIMSEKMDREFSEHLDTLYKNFDDFEVTFIEVDNISDFPTPKHFSQATYYRLLIDEYIDTENDRLLYIDGDTIILEDIYSLAEIDLCGKTIAGVPHVRRRGYEFGLPIDSEYINTGVMVIDLSQWSKYNIGDKCENYIRKNSEDLELPIQETINKVAYNDILLIEPRYNLTYDWRLEYKLSGKECNAKIVHFTTGRKPWKYSQYPEYKEEYYNYVKRTPYSEQVMEDAKLSKFPIRLFRKSSYSDDFKIYVGYLRNIL
ncbi:glycosyltransferase family 8 protein [Halorubrum sp. Ea1]|uniref:glycosyltransferase family 8 protein n=1 Tax=Halorubrum sp. Ea1 TaxID=1480718 RepID=UPI001595071B|nr:glycosyltransferase family 8 protein [Halorubrum sp. Ea1]